MIDWLHQRLHTHMEINTWEYDAQVCLSRLPWIRQASLFIRPHDTGMMSVSLMGPIKEIVTFAESLRSEPSYATIMADLYDSPHYIQISP